MEIKRRGTPRSRTVAAVTATVTLSTILLAGTSAGAAVTSSAGGSPIGSPANNAPHGRIAPAPKTMKNGAQTAAGTQVVIDFSDLANGTVVTDQYPSATFSSTAGNVNYVSDQSGYNTPTFICTGPVGGGIDCAEDTEVTFTSPVSGLTFDAVGVNDTGQVALVDVYNANGLEAAVPIMGDAGVYTAQLVDLSIFTDVTSIDITDISDAAGIGWTDFSFVQAPGFTVNGSQMSTTGEAGKQDVGSAQDAAKCASVKGQKKFTRDELLGAFTAGSWQNAGLTNAAQFLADFLAGSGYEVDLPDTSSLAAEIQGSSEFTAENKDILAYVKKELAAGDTQINLPPGPDNVHALAFLRYVAEPDLYWALRRTNGITVSGSGNQVGSDYVGTLTYVINESYGFSEANTLGGVGTAMRYLQTSCGAPYYQGGAHWFPLTVTVTQDFSIPVGQ